MGVPYFGQQLPRVAAALAAQAHPRSVYKIRHVIVVCSVGLTLAGCGGSEVLFQSSFNADPAGAPPLPNQATGTVSVTGEAGSVVIVPPPPNTGSDQWVQINRKNERTSPIDAMQANFTQVRGDGTYGLLSVLYIPKGSGFATLELDAVNIGQIPVALLHLDFANRCSPTDAPHNVVRINDHDGNCFGTFQNDQSFTVSINVNVNATQPAAHVQLLGAGASGAADIPLATPLFEPASFAEQFGAVAFSMGSPWTGPFDVTDIIVTYRRPTIANAPP